LNKQKKINQNINIADENKTYAVFAQQLIQMIDSRMNITNETQVKNIRKLSQAILDSFNCGAIISPNITALGL
jgi:hypothetical protein